MKMTDLPHLLHACYLSNLTSSMVACNERQKDRGMHKSRQSAMMSLLKCQTRCNSEDEFEFIILNVV